MNVVKEFQNSVEAQDYNKALFVLINNKDKFEPSVHEYNLGVLWAKKEKFVESRIHLEKAKSMGLINSDVVKNLEVVKDQLGVSYIEQVNSYESKALDFTLSLNLYTPLLMSSILLIAILISIKNMVNSITLGLSLILAALPSIGYLYVKDHFQVNIVREEVSVRKGPSKIFDEIQNLPAGMRIITKKNNGKDWYYVVVPKSHAGWISEPEMETL